ncbi:MAG: beta-ketoacyl-ACP synthase III [Phycisphaerae bacterium]|nr:beta-ketoacyl-ACP synthase III [Phycisphaerae bacterium]
MGDRIPLAIRGMGSALPDRVMTNDDFARILDTSDEWIRTRTGIRERRFANDDEDSLTLATTAATRAIEDAGLTPADIDLIVFATSTPAYPLPATACFLQHALGCRHIPAFDISAACAGFVYAFVIGAGLTHIGGYSHALVVGSEKMSAVTDFQDRATCVILADGAGAAIIGPPDNELSGLYEHMLGADGSGAELIIVPAGGSAKPATAKTVEERQHYMKMRGREVYKFAVTKMQEILIETTRRAGLRVEDLAYVVPHQSNLRIIESAAQKMGLPMDKIAVNIDRYGNTSAASIPMALEEAWRAGKVKAGDWVLMAGFGAGLTWGSALIRL